MRPRSIYNISLGSWANRSKHQVMARYASNLTTRCHQTAVNWILSFYISQFKWRISATTAVHVVHSAVMSLLYRMKQGENTGFHSNQIVSQQRFLLTSFKLVISLFVKKSESAHSWQHARSSTKICRTAFISILPQFL